MKSYQFTEYGQPLELFESEQPTPTGDEVLLRVTACGVCHSDVHMWQGEFDMGGGRMLDVRGGRSLPFTLGHEIAGEVVAVGPTASGVEVGEKRVAFPWIGCGECDICDSDLEHLCMRPQALGTHQQGGFSDHVMIPHSRYLFDHEGIPAELACTYACSGLTAFGALKKVAGRVDRPLIILGAGGVGFAALQIARAIYDPELIMVDIEATKLEAASSAGAAHVVNATDADAARQLKKLTGGGADAVIDCVGSEASAALGFRSVTKSGLLVVVGLFGGSLTVPLPLLPLKNLTIQGSDLGSLREMGELMELAKTGALDPIPVEQRPLAMAQQTLEDLIEGTVVGRAVLVPGR